VSTRLPTLDVCSSNPGKLREFVFTANHSLAGGFTIQFLPSLADIAAPAEDGATYEENAAIKALYYSGFTDELVFADDSGLEVHALGGAPGVHSARFAGLHATGEENNNLLLTKLAETNQRGARFVTAISLARQGAILQTSVGTANGEILSQPRGSLGFGYDALFLFPPFQRTFAELDEPEKFAVSARGEAFRKLLEWLSRNPL
jgi:XTP/dITP diphosphohydrolase